MNTRNNIFLESQVMIVSLGVSAGRLRRCAETLSLFLEKLLPGSSCSSVLVRGRCLTRESLGVSSSELNVFTSDGILHMSTELVVTDGVVFPKVLRALLTGAIVIGWCLMFSVVGIDDTGAITLKWFMCECR